MAIGVPELLILGVLALTVAPLLLVPLALVRLRRRAKRFGYDSVGAYLRAAPRTDAERRDAADLAMAGVVISLLGFMAGPLVLVGLVPLFYGGRKLAYAAMGLGLVDDADDPRR